VASAGAPLWRAMTATDIPEIMVVAGLVHPGYPEDEPVFAERLALYPAGCFCLADNTGMAGYVLSHPWWPLDVPPLNSLLDTIPAAVETYYIHDLALLPQVRGTGAAPSVVTHLAGHARRSGFATLALVAVNDSVAFWERQGFRVTHDAALDRKLASYDDAARYMTRDVMPGRDRAAANDWARRAE
jgi:ribosomal protein S18 acetylase RimI-like enzyme